MKRTILALIAAACGAPAGLAAGPDPGDDAQLVAAIVAPDLTSITLDDWLRRSRFWGIAAVEPAAAEPETVEAVGPPPSENVPEEVSVEPPPPEEAQHLEGRALDEGWNGTVDRAAAARCYETAAKAGNAEAAADLGYLYLSGEGVNADPAQARRWFAQAAAAGHPNGEFALAVMQEKGIGEDSNVPAAIDRYRALAQQGHEAAIERLKVLGP